MTEQYRCAMCGEIFDRTTPKEEALAELHEQFGEDVSVEDCDIVCDDCWEKVKPENNVEIFKAWRKETSNDPQT